jgi:NitT/TauT family transport system ATP-binding protein
MINVNSLTKSFGSHVLFETLCFSLSEGLHCLYGPSGCGKTTLGRILAGLESPDSGTVSGVRGTPVVLFQEPRLLPSLSAKRNVACVSRRKDASNVATDLLLSLGFEKEDLDKKPSELSGGMQQRVSLARALLFASETDGNFALLDEPFRGLDPATKEKAATLIARHLSSRTTLVVTHEEKDALLLQAKTLVFSDLIDGIC